MTGLTVVAVISGERRRVLPGQLRAGVCYRILHCPHLHCLKLSHMKNFQKREKGKEMNKVRKWMESNRENACQKDTWMRRRPTVWLKSVEKVSQACFHSIFSLFTTVIVNCKVAVYNHILVWRKNGIFFFKIAVLTLPSHQQNIFSSTAYHGAPCYYL